MINLEIQQQVSEEAASFYAFFIERAKEIFALEESIKTLTLEKRDVPVEVLEHLAMEHGNPLKYDHSENRIAYHGVTFEAGNLMWLNFYSKPVDAPPAKTFTVTCEGQDFTFEY